MDARDIKQKFELGNTPLTTALLEEQENLLVKYKDIENLPQWPLNLDIPVNQVILKDFISRITEELAEAEEYHKRIQMGEEGLGELMNEELIDALHFYLDLVILIGPEHIMFDMEQSIIEHPLRGITSLPQMIHELNYELFIGRNELKNKPWKQTQMPTDTHSFINHIEAAGVYFNIIFYNLAGWNKAVIYNNYMKKHTVNIFRQRSKY